MVLAVVGGLGVVIGAAVSPQQLGYSYLLAFMFFFSICLGGLFLTLLHHLFDAQWSVPIRRVTEHMGFLLPVMGVLFIPIALLAKKIYPWFSINPADDHALHAKSALINPTAFYVMAVIIFGVLSYLAWRLRRWSTLQDKSGSIPDSTGSMDLAEKILSTLARAMGLTFEKDLQIRCQRMRRLHAAWGIFAFAFLLTMGAIFWVKSLQHQWFSTMYGVYYFAGSVWLTYATVYVIALVLQRGGPLAEVVRPSTFKDIATMFFCFTVFYAYIHFSQYFLIWNAAMPEETFWYVLRESGTWWQAGLVILFGHFFLPFLTLLRIDAKLSLAVMLPMAVWAWMMHFLDMSFNITPVLQIFRKYQEGEDLAHHMATARPDNFAIHPLDIACMAFIGGVLAILFIRYFKAYPAYPQKDPRIAECMGVYVPPAKSMVAHGGAQ